MELALSRPGMERAVNDYAATETLVLLGLLLGLAMGTCSGGALVLDMQQFTVDNVAKQ